MRFDVIPTVKVNEAEFGMSRAEVRGLMGQPKSEFRKFSDENTTDEYDSYHVFYDEDDRLEAVEIFNDEGVEVYVGDVLVFPTDLVTARELIPDSEIDDDGLTCVAQSIGIYAPDALDETVSDPEVEGILFGKRGYYDE